MTSESRLIASIAKTDAEEMNKHGSSMLYAPNRSAKKLGKRRPKTLPAFKKVTLKSLLEIGFFKRETLHLTA